MAPVINYLAGSLNINPMVIYGIICIINSIILLKLPETLG